MKISKKNIKQTIKIKNLFDSLNIISNKDEEILIKNNFNIKIKTSVGYKNIEAFRLVKQEVPVTIYLENNLTLKASKDHYIKTLNRNWVKIKDLNIFDFVETESGYSRFSKFKVGNRKETLYDLQVEDIHSYFTNKINSHNTHFLVNLAANAAKIGKNALFISMELGSNAIETRIDANYTGIEIDKIKFHKEHVKKELERFKKEENYGDIFVKYFPTGTVSVQNLKTYTDQLRATGFKPDIILVDYADILKPGRYYKDAHRLEQKGIYEELRGWAGESRTPIWTASQAGKQTVEKDWIGIEDLSESFGKAMVADVIMGLTRKIDQRLDNEGKLFLAKSRVGRDGIIFPLDFDASTSTIIVHSSDDDMTKDILSGVTKANSGRIKMSSRKKSSIIDELKKEFDVK